MLQRHRNKGKPYFADKTVVEISRENKVLAVRLTGLHARKYSLHKYSSLSNVELIYRKADFDIKYHSKSSWTFLPPPSVSLLIGLDSLK